MNTIYRAPLLSPETGEIDAELARILTLEQLARLAEWSLQTNRSIGTLLRDARFMAEQTDPDSPHVRLVGTMPHCQLFGSLEPDGSCHT